MEKIQGISATSKKCGYPKKYREERSVSKNIEQISQKKAIFERYREGLADLPLQMNPMPETVNEMALHYIEV